MAVVTRGGDVDVLPAVAEVEDAIGRSRRWQVRVGRIAGRGSSR
jgi:hypothetical protein